MRNLEVDYGQAATLSRNISSSLNHIEDELSKINGAISEIEALNRSYGKTSSILNELYDQKRKAEKAYDEMQTFYNKLEKFISNVKITDEDIAKKFKAEVKSYCKKNDIEITTAFDSFLDKLQTTLDVVGFIPGIGAIADGINAIISVCRGNYLEALISVVAMLPMGDLV